MFVIGIDPGLTRTGYGLVRSGSPPVAISGGVLSTPPRSPVAERLSELFRDLSELLDQERPQVMAVERVFTNRNLHTAVEVSRASGVILLAASHFGIPVVEYTPTTIKLAVTGDGSAQKSQVQSMVARRLKLDTIPRPADAADALAVALCHLQSLRIRGAS